MKYIFLSALFCFSAFAEEVTFKCSFSDVTYVNQFSIEATKVEIQDGKFTNAEFDFTVRKAGRDQQPERLVVSRDGVAQTFAAGTLYRHSTMRLASVVKGADVEYINLLLDMTPAHISQIRLLNGTTYFGSCKRQ